MTQEDTAQFWHDYGITMTLARRAAHLAIEEQRRLKRIGDSAQSAIGFYTDDPNASAHLACNAELATICKVADIEFVAIIMGENFPRAAHEAERADPEMPRIAAIWFPPKGHHCPRCRSWQAADPDTLCERCASVVAPTKEL